MNGEWGRGPFATDNSIPHQNDNAIAIFCASLLQLDGQLFYLSILGCYMQNF